MDTYFNTFCIKIGVHCEKGDPFGYTTFGGME